MSAAAHTGGDDERAPGGLEQKLNRLRAGVLGANDGIVSTAAVVVGVAAVMVLLPRIRRTLPASLEVAGRWMAISVCGSRLESSVTSLSRSSTLSERSTE